MVKIATFAKPENVSRNCSRNAKKQEMNLREKLKDWTDIDIAIHHIAVELGLFKTDNFTGYLWVQWTENKYSDFLDKTLRSLIEIEMLEYNVEENTIRFNESFEVEIKP